MAKGYDVIVVGAGPSGSSCAGALKRGGVKVALLDMATFPRDKLCAGWVTPDVFDRLELNPAHYPFSLLRYEKIQFHFKQMRLPISSTQYSIRRREFDHFLLERSGVTPIVHQARQVEHDGDNYVVDGEYCAPILVGAGGTRCPVFRKVFSKREPRPKNAQIVALEKEFPFEWSDNRCHLFFFDDGLAGYSWYVPKQGGYLNCGVGGMAHTISGSDRDIRAHWRTLCNRLNALGVSDELLQDPSGYSYFLRDQVEFGHHEGAYLVGDAAGLATRDLGEGIGPGVHSGLAAAHSILTGSAYDLRSVYAYSPIKQWLSSRLDRRWKQATARVA